MYFDLYNGTQAVEGLAMESGHTTGDRLGSALPVTPYNGIGLAILSADVQGGNLDVAICTSGTAGRGGPIASFDTVEGSSVGSSYWDVIPVNVDSGDTHIYVSGHLDAGKAAYGVLFLGRQDNW